ncbi:MAG: hypothetical protein NTZ42_00880 [Candidatus Gribaldobacteria bacterium]|nr:hypothetical protein [Candidatus Gribaldobacteria bacterium]
MYCQERKIEKLLAVVLAVFVLAIVGIGYVLAANNGNSFGYAWSEGFGWIRLDGTASLQTYGVTVPNGEGSFLTGYAWGEDAGWIHFSGSCDTAGGCPQGFGNTYGVVASRASCSVGAVCLSGYAWGEGVGWIRFAATSSTYANNGATTYGVYIDANGQFQGYACRAMPGARTRAGYIFQVRAMRRVAARAAETLIAFQEPPARAVFQWACG